MHAVLSLKHRLMLILCRKESPEHGFCAILDIAFEDWSKLLMITDKYHLLCISEGLQRLYLLRLRRFINYDFLELQRCQSSAAC